MREIVIPPKKYKICRYWRCDLLDNLALTWHQRTEGPIHSENVFKIKLVVWDFWVLSSKVTTCYMGFLYKSQRKCFPWFCLLFSICTCGLDCIPPPPQPQKIIFNQNQFLCTLLWKSTSSLTPLQILLDHISLKWKKEAAGWGKDTVRVSHVNSNKEW